MMLENKMYYIIAQNKYKEYKYVITLQFTYSINL